MYRFAEAEAAFREAIDIQRELAAQNPAAYWPYLVRTLNNLASLYRAAHRDNEAKAIEAEAFRLRKEPSLQRRAATEARSLSTSNHDEAG